MALTYKESQLVRGTIPALRQHGETVTSFFYANMLHDHPELQDYFNTANQSNGRQPRALTSVILTFAANLNHISELIPKLERMCNKHCSLGIRPEHYGIVCKYLIRAFAEVLGPVMTPEVRAAWTKAYWVLAKMLIGREAQMYQDFDGDRWKGWRKFRIERRVLEADDIASFYLVPADGGKLPDFLPGQYVSVRLAVPAMGHLQIRQYSLSDAPRPDRYRITVKREPGTQVAKGGDAFALHPGVVSHVLLDGKKAGDTLELTHPAGAFHLDPQPPSTTLPLVLVSAGVGAAPLMSVLNTVVPTQPARPISWIQCAARQAPFEAHVRNIAASGRPAFTTRFFRSAIADVDENDPNVRAGDYALHLDLAKLEPEVLYLDHGAAEYYICGPEVFMAEMSQFLMARGVNVARVKFERFTTGDMRNT